MQDRELERLPTRASIAPNVVVVACAISAGAHAGLVPAHMREEPRLGVAFVLAVTMVVVAGAALVLRPRSAHAAQVAALLLAGLIGACTASRTTAIPLLSPEAETVDVVGLTTNVVRAIGLVFALKLNQVIGIRRSPIDQEATP